MHTKYESMCPTLAKKDTLQSLATFACPLFHMRDLFDDPHLLERYACKQGHGDEAKSTVEGLAVRISTLIQP